MNAIAQIFKNFEIEEHRLRENLRQGRGGYTELQTLYRIFYGEDAQEYTSLKYYENFKIEERRDEPYK
jgi:hypothetical protein